MYHIKARYKFSMETEHLDEAISIEGAVNLAEWYKKNRGRDWEVYYIAVEEDGCSN